MIRFLVFCCLLLCLLPSTAMLAQDREDTPPYNAEYIRQTLFDAQIALMSGSFETAQHAVQNAAQRAQTAFGDALRPELEPLFIGMNTAIAAQDTAAFAAWRAQVWTTMLHHAFNTVREAVQAGDDAKAALWLPLREFRPSNRFSRPNTEATQALMGWQRGLLTREAAYALIEANLYDTYQGQMMGALSDARTAQAEGFPIRRSEEAGRAAGYFRILSSAYAQQRTPETAAAMQTAFSDMIAASQMRDAALFSEALRRIENGLTGFRAAPLSEKELVRRAGQLMRYLALVPIEYSRGVRNGVITNPIEIQEAITFHRGAAAAFGDLRASLPPEQQPAAERANIMLAAIADGIRAVIAPDDLQRQTDMLTAELNALIPPEWIAVGGASDVDVILEMLNGLVSAAAARDYTAAESARLEAYAILELGIEQRLRGFAPEIALTIESLFWQGTGEMPGLAVLLTTEAPLVQVRATVAALKTAFEDASFVLNSGGAAGAVITNAAVIVFREGLEAVLILASLIASLRSVEQRRFRQPLIAGAVLACVATVLTWWAASGLLNLLLPYGERLEAVVSLIAVGVLLLITNWFFHKTYWTGWMANFHARKRRLIGGIVSVGVGQSIGLMLLGFTSIYREGFETVLFLQALILDAGTGVVLQGVVFGLLGTVIVGVITFSLQVRLPYKKMLIVTGIFIGVVLLTMVGNTAHVMQAIGWLPITPIQGVFLPFWMGQWFGMYATWQGILLQAAAAIFVIGSYFLAESQNNRVRSGEHSAHRQPT